MNNSKSTLKKVVKAWCATTFKPFGYPDAAFILLLLILIGSMVQSLRLKQWPFSDWDGFHPALVVTLISAVIFFIVLPHATKHMSSVGKSITELMDTGEAPDNLLLVIANSKELSDSDKALVFDDFEKFGLVNWGRLFDEEMTESHKEKLAGKGAQALAAYKSLSAKESQEKAS